MSILAASLNHFTMFRIVMLCGLLTMACMVRAQAPQGISYQAVMRDGSGQLLQNQNVSIRFSILQGSTSGPTVYAETQLASTNSQGLYTAVLGTGNVLSGSFSAIDWASGPYFLKSETDLSGGTNYSLESTQSLWSVPYALYAGQSGSILPGPEGPQGATGPEGPQGPPGPTGATGPAGASSCETVGEGNLMVVYTPNQAVGFSQSQGSNLNYSTGTYNVQSMNGTVLGAASSELQIVVYTSTHAYAFAQSQSSLGTNWNSATWNSQSLNGNVLGALASKQNIVVYTDSNVYGFSQSQSSLGNPPSWNSGTWVSQSISGTVLGAKASSRCIMVYTSTGVYSFSQSQSSLNNPPPENTGTWVFQSLSSAPVDGIVTH